MKLPKDSVLLITVIVLVCCIIASTIYTSHTRDSFIERHKHIVPNMSSYKIMHNIGRISGVRYTIDPFGKIIISLIKSNGEHLNQGEIEIVDLRIKKYHSECADSEEICKCLNDKMSAKK